MAVSLYTSEEVGELLGVTGRTIRAWTKKGLIRSERRIGNAQVYTAAEVARVMKAPRPRPGRPWPPRQKEELPLRVS